MEQLKTKEAKSYDRIMDAFAEHGVIGNDDGSAAPDIVVREGDSRVKGMGCTGVAGWYEFGCGPSSYDEDGCICWGWMDWALVTHLWMMMNERRVDRSASTTCSRCWRSGASSKKERERVGRFAWLLLDEGRWSFGGWREASIKILRAPFHHNP